ncbi:glycosyl hydrolase [Lipomyces starkeyi]
MRTDNHQLEEDIFMSQPGLAVSMNPLDVRDPRVDGPQGDAIPFFHEGRYHLFYLEAPAGKYDQPDRGRTPWRHIVSDNLVDWHDLGIALPLGEGDDPDIDGIWTGSIIAVDGVLHVFYTGGRRSACIPQTVCHATSRDGVLFKKSPSNPIHFPRSEWFEQRDWRDPFVFWNEEHKQYWMLITARANDGPPGRRGVIALSTSDDLVSWTTVCEPFYAPGNTYSMECPEVFRLGGKWRLVFSRFTEYAATVYREAEDLAGPWRTPKYPALDGARWYAAKSLEDAQGRRIAFGWVHDRRGFVEGGEWLWGGDMCLPREIFVGDEDRLCVRPPREVDAQLTSQRPLPIRQASGATTEEWEASAAGTFSIAEIEIGALQRSLARLTVEADLQDLAGGVGLALYSNTGLTEGLLLFFDASTGTISLGGPTEGEESDRLPVPWVTNQIAGRSRGKLRFDLYLRGDVLEIFVDRQVALTHRQYFERPFTAEVYVEDGVVTFRATLATRVN